MPEKSIKEERSRDSDSLHDACGREGCPVCTVVLEYLDHIIDNWEYEGFTDVSHRYELINSRGFCPLHTGQLVQRGNSFTLGLIYNEILTDVEQALEQEYSKFTGDTSNTQKQRTSFKKLWNRPFQRSGETPTPASPRYDLCPFCQARSKIEQRVVSTLVQQLQFEDMRQLLSQSTGLCLVHLKQARHEAERTEPEVSGHILACQLTCIRRVEEELRELVRKHDYRFSDEPRGDEMTSWRRGAALCAGNPGIR